MPPALSTTKFSKKPSSMPVYIVAAAIAAVAMIIFLLLQSPKLPGGPVTTPDPNENRPSVGEVRKSPTIGGTVKSVEGNQLMIDVIGVPAESGLQYDASVRTAKLRSDTKIILTIDRSSTEMKRLLDAYAIQVKKANVNTMPAPPSAYTIRNGTIADINIGDSVSVLSVDGADIATASEFEVSQVSIHRTAE